MQDGVVRVNRNVRLSLAPVAVLVCGNASYGLYNHAGGTTVWVDDTAAVFEEEKAEQDALVLSGVHAAAERIGHFPRLSFVADVVGCGFIVCFCFGACFLFSRHVAPRQRRLPTVWDSSLSNRYFLRLWAQIGCPSRTVAHASVALALKNFLIAHNLRTLPMQLARLSSSLDLVSAMLAAHARILKALIRTVAHLQVIPTIRPF